MLSRTRSSINPSRSHPRGKDSGTSDLLRKIPQERAGEAGAQSCGLSGIPDSAPVLRELCDVKTAQDCQDLRQRRGASVLSRWSVIVRDCGWMEGISKCGRVLREEQTQVVSCKVHWSWEVFAERRSLSLTQGAPPVSTRAPSCMSI